MRGCLGFQFPSLSGFRLATYLALRLLVACRDLQPVATSRNHNRRPQCQVISRANEVRRLGRRADFDRVGAKKMTVVL